MCELFALSARHLAIVDLSLDEFSSHGAPTNRNRDGWGIAYYEGRDVRLVKEAEPAASSDWVRFIESHRLRSHLVVAHIRHATRGRIAFENTQPFVRELGGRAHLFAHNGDLPGVQDAGLRKGRFRPIGETDSEVAFCGLLADLEDSWLRGEPSIDERLAVVTRFAHRLRGLGPANFIYADGEIMFVHSDRRCPAPAQSPRPPGLHVLERRCAVGANAQPGAGVTVVPHPDEQRVVLVASLPLTDEAWHPLQEGALLAISEGRIVAGLGA
jgi:predicted glutamine amidotransferase